MSVNVYKAESFENSRVFTFPTVEGALDLDAALDPVKQSLTDAQSKIEDLPDDVSIRVLILQPNHEHNGAARRALDSFAVFLGRVRSFRSSFDYGYLPGDKRRWYNTIFNAVAPDIWQIHLGTRDLPPALTERVNFPPLAGAPMGRDLFDSLQDGTEDS